MNRLLAFGVVGGLAFASPAVAGFDEIITFDEVPLGTDANGLTIKNATFSYSQPERAPIVLPVSIGIAPTPNTSGQLIQGSTFGSLGIRFGQPVSRFGFGFALSLEGFFEDAVRVDLFDPEGSYLTTLKADADSVDPFNRGVLPANGAVFADGFGCIGSAVVSFLRPRFRSEDDTAGATATFFFDNLGYDFCDMAPVPLPSASLLGGAGLMALGAVRRRHRH